MIYHLGRYVREVRAALAAYLRAKATIRRVTANRWEALQITDGLPPAWVARQLEMTRAIADLQDALATTIRPALLGRSVTRKAWRRRDG